MVVEKIVLRKKKYPKDTIISCDAYIVAKDVGEHWEVYHEIPVCLSIDDDEKIESKIKEANEWVSLSRLVYERAKKIAEKYNLKLEIEEEY